MPTISDTGICIRRWDFSETSQTVSLFLRDAGIIRGLVKGAKRPGGAFSGGIDLLSLGRVAAIVKPTSELATVTEWHLLETFPALRESLEANRAGLYMADLIHHMLNEHDPHPRLFDAMLAALRALSEAPAAPHTLLRFEWALLCETGYRPQLDRDARTGQELPASGPTLAFSAGAGGVVSDTGEPDRWRVRRETIELIRDVASGGSPEAEPGRWRRGARLLAAYIRQVLGTEPKAMRWAFPELSRNEP